MADFQKRRVTSVRHEYVIKTPSNAVELGKAMDSAIRAMPEDQVKWDDAIKVIVGDDEIILYWIEETTNTQSGHGIIINDDRRPNNTNEVY